MAICRVENCYGTVSWEGHCRRHFLTLRLGLPAHQVKTYWRPLNRLRRAELEKLSQLPLSQMTAILKVKADAKPRRRPAPSLYKQYLDSVVRQGPRRRGPCVRWRCEEPEARDGMCRYHWLLTTISPTFRRDVARTIPVENLTMDKLADIRERGNSDWAYIRFIAHAPFEPEPLEVENRRHRLRTAYRGAATCILAAILGWAIRRIGRDSPPVFTADPRPDATPGECITMALAPAIAESLFLGRPIELPERRLWKGIEPPATYLRPTTPEEKVMAVIRETQPMASFEDLIASFRAHEAVTANQLCEPELWQRIEHLAEALAASA